MWGLAARALVGGAARGAGARAVAGRAGAKAVAGTARTAAQQAATTGAGRFTQMKAGARAAAATPQVQQAVRSQVRTQVLNSALAPPSHQAPAQGTPMPGNPSGLNPYNPGRGFGRGGNIAPTEGGGSGFLRGGYKSFTGSEALTGVAVKSDYMPYEFGTGYKTTPWTAGRGFRSQGDTTNWGAPDPSTRIGQPAVGPGVKPFGEIGPGVSPMYEKAAGPMKELGPAGSTGIRSPQPTWRDKQPRYKQQGLGI